MNAIGTFVAGGRAQTTDRVEGVAGACLIKHPRVFRVLNGQVSVYQRRVHLPRMVGLVASLDSVFVTDDKSYDLEGLWRVVSEHLRARGRRRVVPVAVAECEGGYVRWWCTTDPGFQVVTGLKDRVTICKLTGLKEDLYGSEFYNV